MVMTRTDASGVVTEKMQAACEKIARQLVPAEADAKPSMVEVESFRMSLLANAAMAGIPDDTMRLRRVLYAYLREHYSSAQLALVNTPALKDALDTRAFAA